MKKILHKIKNHKNKKLFFKTLLNMLIITFLLTILSGLIYVLINRQSLSLQAGHRLFGGSIFGKHLYNIDMAERFFLYSNSFDNKLEWNNYQLSRVNFIRGNLISAIDYANKELEYFPDNCRTHYIRGLAYSYNNQVDKAISDFEYFNKCFPGS
ncbi:MAG: hypothetical protein QM532_04200 [Cyanobium sp. MAG06]|nr:hypothetical protein [Cyanobium sp. MAG06]